MSNTRQAPIWPLFVLIVLALIPRLAVAPKLGHRGDELLNEQFSLDFLTYGSRFYEEARYKWSVYPPMMLYLFGGASGLWKALGGDLIPGSVSFRVLMKSLAMLGDVGLLIIVYIALLRTRSVTHQLLYGCAIALNPVLIFDSAIWGQFESLVLLALVAAVISCQRKRPYLALALAIVAVMLKPQAIVAIPLIFLATYQIVGGRTSTLAIVVALVIGMALMAPFLVNASIPAIRQAMVGSGQDNLRLTSLNAFNIWGLAGFFESQYQKIAGLTYLSWGLIMGGLSYLWACYVQWRSRDSGTLWASLTLAYLGIFLFMTMMHERYICYPAILATVWLIVDRRIFWSWLILMVVGVLNMHYRLRIPNWQFLHQLQDTHIILYVGVLLNMVAYAMLSRIAAINLVSGRKQRISRCCKGLSQY